MTQPLKADVPPQRLLDDLHAVAVPNAFAPGLNARARQEAIDDARQRLSAVRQRISQQISQIEKRGSRKDRQATTIALQPYQKLATLASELNDALDHLHAALADGRVLPQAFSFGTVIFGHQETGEWHLGDVEEASRWEEMRQVRRKLDAMMAQRQPLMQALQTMKAELDPMRSEAERIQKRLRHITKGRGIIARLLIIALAGMASLITGIYVFQVAGQSAPGAALIGLGAVLLLVPPLLWRRRRRRIAQLRASLHSIVEQLRHKQLEGKRLRQRFLPIDEMCRTLKLDYDALRASFAS